MDEDAGRVSSCQIYLPERNSKRGILSTAGYILALSGAKKLLSKAYPIPDAIRLSDGPLATQRSDGIELLSLAVWMSACLIPRLTIVIMVIIPTAKGVMVIGYMQLLRDQVRRALGIPF